MIRKLVVFLCLTIFSFAADATVEIVKKIDVLPKIAIQDASAKNVDLEFRKSFFKLLAGDLRVSNLVGSDWSKPEKLNTNINSESWEGSCSITADGRYLYFLIYIESSG